MEFSRRAGKTAEQYHKKIKAVKIIGTLTAFFFKENKWIMPLQVLLLQAQSQRQLQRPLQPPQQPSSQLPFWR